ncbi:hypothetical protein [Pseudomonas gessardii]|nr:hypothetical protein [Pseudomonas gessardii]NNA99114.1 hypothetical protein [Pseudomonas gessardii]
MYHLFDSERVLSEVKNTEFSRHNDFAKLLLLYIEDFFNLEPDSLALDVRGKVKASIEVLRLLSKKELHLFYIVFPPGEEGEKIFSILECVGRLRFTQCSFLVGRIELKKPKVSFFDCEFISNYDVLDMNLRKDKAYDDCLYQRCVFRGNVSCGSDERKERLIIRHSLFSDCKFFGRVRFENAELQGYFVDGDPRYPSSLSRLKVENCIFQNGFYINSQKMAYAYLTSCVFQGKFEFKQNSVDRLIFDNCNFKKISDFYASSIRRFTLRKSIFDTFVGFEECHFGVLPGPRRRSITPEIGIGLACFIYVTFLEFASFRGARFNEGLDLEKINTIEQPNFHRVFVSFAETPRETFRMIKHA